MGGNEPCGNDFPVKAAIALLTDRDTANAVNKAAWEMHCAYRTGVFARRLPPHVSLKQPFEAGDLTALALWAAQFAASITPFDITLGDYQLWEQPQTATLSRQVVETPTLRGLHNRLNAELIADFGDTVQAEFDGDAYAFHLTVAAGEGSVEAYCAAFDERQRPGLTSQTFTARELALFVYENDDGRADWAYIVYATYPLGD